MDKSTGGVVYSVVIPVYNSSLILETLYERVIRVMEMVKDPFEVIFVEDAGRDNSWEIVKAIAQRDVRVIAIRLMRNFGQSNAVMCGMKKTRGNYIITMDDDLQNPPEEIPNLIKAIKNSKDVDVVMGIPDEKKHSFLRNMGSDIVCRLNSRVFKRSSTIKLSSFRIMSRNLVNNLESFHLLNSSIDALISATTAHIKNIPVQHNLRLKGASGYNFSRLFTQTLNNFIGFSIFPLRFIAILGVIGILVSVAYSTYLLGRFLFFKNIGVPGWLSVVLLLNILSGFTFFAFGLIGEYLIKILQSTTREAPYFVKEIINIQGDK